MKKIIFITLSFLTIISSNTFADQLKIFVRNFTSNNLTTVSNWQMEPRLSKFKANNASISRGGYLQTLKCTPFTEKTNNSIDFNAWYNVYDYAGNYLGHCELKVNGVPLEGTDGFGDPYSTWDPIDTNGTFCSNGIKVYAWIGNDNPEVYFSIYPS